MNEMYRIDYSHAMSRLVRDIGTHDDPRLPALDATTSEVLAFDLSQRSRVAMRRVWMAGPEGQELMRELCGESADDESSDRTPQAAANSGAGNEPVTEDLLSEKFRRLTQRR